MDDIKKQHKRTRPENTEVINRELILALKGSDNPAEKRKEMARILKENFHVEACIIALLDKSDKTMKLDVIDGEIPYREKTSSKEDPVTIDFIIKKAERFLELAKRKATDETIVSTIKIENGKLIGIIATLVWHKGELLGMVIIVKDMILYKSSQRIFDSIYPHIKAVFIRSLGLDKP